MDNYKVGYYKPTYEFTRIPEFMAIYDQEDELIGVTGPATSQKAALEARLFAAAPELLQILKQCCAVFPQIVLPVGAANSAGMNENVHSSLPRELWETLQKAQALLATLEYQVRMIS